MKSSRRSAQAEWAKCIAHATRLGRAVAIKILPAHLSAEAVRRQRFEREAKTISRLNHPRWFTGFALIAVVIWSRNSNPPVQTMYFPAPMAVPASDIAVAPNGHTIAVVAYLESARKNALWIYELGSPDARSLVGTEGASYPFWSADGQSLAFFAEGKLKKLDISGGPVQIICDAPAMGVATMPLS